MQLVRGKTTPLTIYLAIMNMEVAYMLATSVFSEWAASGWNGKNERYGQPVAVSREYEMGDLQVLSRCRQQIWI